MLSVSTLFWIVVVAGWVCGGGGRCGGAGEGGAGRAGRGRSRSTSRGG